MITPRQNLRANLLLLAITMIWGVTFVVVKGALADCSPTLFNLLRMVLASVVLLGFTVPAWPQSNAANGSAASWLARCWPPDTSSKPSA